MKNQFNLSINKPCYENFNQFKSTSLGGFCETCKKEVIDFSKMNSKEISNYINYNNSKKICGQFNKSQLTNYPTSFSKSKKHTFFSAIAFSLISFFSLNSLYAQKEDSFDNKKRIIQNKEKSGIQVKGIVTDEGGTLPGVNILLQGTNIGVETDFDGNFIFPKPLKKGDVLIFSFIGLESRKVIIDNKNSKSTINLKIKMKSDSCMLLGQVSVKKIFKSK
ncbi:MULTISPECIES: carboxypeptidase-like regulatory domain-containing protein [unclassified Tenacibaculum]|uniref:carboxypeptidase-like regulatory domain-containing protein n=1 Tax=unclassified Tenacibaculum TaxID=2635139 RepID=UPI001F2B9065|nr:MULTISPECIES: carboxypeptidase-like regulatory domain-containing protein [unclassified Tenacibaculum]MCF2874184.1 carboxypeptidase-like regulatory domain-containing protein [Tenacibaculum sp. Cn5-1]MCF2934765.1 carboxypeptidase-like regulatory domain-containing protein [Tenacibaculum sp. Cn5-34]MCG7510975.1 carboxypeptidase-like regulatory domain-containing protein [Tenacibaculum sp. Cn5-46]